MDDKFKLYDEICETGVKWLLCKIKEEGKPLCVSNISLFAKEDMWVLSVLRWVDVMSRAKTYYSGSIIKFLILKYFKRFKFLKYAFNTKDKFIINAKEFGIEIVKVFDKLPFILGDIYEEYYKGGRK